MTMKNRKTLAAVAVVLLALALVFVAPVSADGEDTVSETPDFRVFQTQCQPDIWNTNPH